MVFIGAVSRIPTLDIAMFVHSYWPDQQYQSLTALTALMALNCNELIPLAALTRHLHRQIKRCIDVFTSSCTSALWGCSLYPYATVNLVHCDAHCLHVLSL